MGFLAAAAPARAANNAQFDRLSHQFIEALWRQDPEAAVAAGRYEFAPQISIPDAAPKKIILRLYRTTCNSFIVIKL